MFSDHALASFNNINLSAPTHAVTTRSSEVDESSRMSFQVQQSRIGTLLTKDKITGKFEADFIDFSKSSPTTQSNPRLRIASITYKKGNNTFIFGQDWDLFSPAGAYTLNIVGLYFLGGNTGFIRQQFQYLKRSGNWELGSAIGMAGNNPGVVDNNLETGKSPSYSARISYEIDKGKIGLSGIYSTLHFDQSGENGSSHDAYGVNLFYEQLLAKWGFKSELYYSQNLANIGSLSIGKGTDDSDVREFGGLMTLSYQIDDQNILFGGVGIASVNNPQEITPFSLATSGTIQNPGIRRNQVSKIGWDYKITVDFSLVSEVSRYETTNKLSENSYLAEVAWSIESGMLLKF